MNWGEQKVPEYRKGNRNKLMDYNLSYFFAPIGSILSNEGLF